MLVKPILYSILACFFWGLIFVVPLYLHHFYPVDIVLGRYLVFGLWSALLLTYGALKAKSWDILSYWKQASFCALIMNFSYYTALILGIRLSNPSLIALIIGLAPITILATSCKLEKSSAPYSIFLNPSLCIFLGIVLINVDSIQAEWYHLTVWQYVQGILYGFWALGAWTWYAVYNTYLLHKHPKLNPGQWTNLIGVVTLALTLIGILIRGLTIDESYLKQFSMGYGQGLDFIAGVLMLGVLSSWLAFSLWNIASSKLPSELSGQLAILETVFGLFFIYLIKRQWPALLEIAGILLVLGGVWRGLYNFSEHKKLE